MLVQYLKNSIWDFLLCCLLSASLAGDIVQGFYVPVFLSTALMPLLLTTLAVQGILVFAAYNRRTIWAGIGFFLLCAVLLIVLVQGGWFAGWEGAVEYYFIAVLVSLAVFLLSRTRLGMLILLVLGVLLLAAAAFLQYTKSAVPFLLFLWGGFCLLFDRIYRHNVLHTRSARPAFSAYAALTSVICALALAAGFAFHFVVIAPLRPPTRELKLVTRLMSLEVLEKLGVASHVEIFDNEKFAQANQDSNRISSNQGETPQESPQTQPQRNDDPAGQRQDSQDQVKQYGSGLPETVSNAISYLRKDYTALYLAGAVLLAIAALAGGKHLQRRLRYRALRKGNRKEQVIHFYHFFVKQFQKLKLPSRGTDTPLEYSTRLGPLLARTFREEPAFSDLTAVFMECCYGDREPDEEGYRKYLAYYGLFYRNCRRTLGLPGYALRFFAL